MFLHSLGGKVYPKYHNEQNNSVKLFFKWLKHLMCIKLAYSFIRFWTFFEHFKSQKSQPAKMSTTVNIQYRGIEVHALLGSCLKTATVPGMTTDTWLLGHTVPLPFFGSCSTNEPITHRSLSNPRHLCKPSTQHSAWRVLDGWLICWGNGLKMVLRSHLWVRPGSQLWSYFVFFLRKCILLLSPCSWNRRKRSRAKSHRHKNVHMYGRSGNLPLIIALENRSTH